MNYRITDNNKESSIARINAQRSRLNVLQERIASGKRINRPSDDPAGAEAVINLRTTQTEIEQFKRSAATSAQKLSSADEALNNYENVLTRVRTLVAQGLSGTTTQQSRNSLATEIESLRERILSVATLESGDEFLFGGTRQDAPPFDPVTAAPAAAPAAARYVQIEPGAKAIAVGVTADTVFADSGSTIFTDLNDAVNALRGTGNPGADQTTLENTMARLGIYSDLAGAARARVGVNMNAAEIAQERLTGDSLSLEERVSSIETADFAETALELAATQSTLDATLQVAAQKRRSLFDFLG